MPGPNMTCLKAMYKDITRLLGDDETSDMIVKCGEEELKVHSFVMMARSPVFHRMLTTDMVEKKDKMVTVKDWQVEVVREMVNFMYTATISPNFNNLVELLAIGDKYCVSSLVTLCSSLLASTIKPETALEMGVFGEMHSADELVDKCAMRHVHLPGPGLFGGQLDGKGEGKPQADHRHIAAYQEGKG